MPMKKTIKTIVLKALCNAGFASASQQTISLFCDIFSIYLQNNLTHLKNITTQSNRSKSTILDIFYLTKYHKILSMKEIYEILNNRIEKDTEVYVKSSKNNIIEDKKEDLFTSIYSFMPSFPLPHTYKRTFENINKKEDKAKKIKMRLEQSRTLENNLIKIYRYSNKIPYFINFLYK
ncbi:hypothetical protein SLOPH_1840 [Spraguea lophii 42_110]|uniref:Transcription factor TFIID subunit 8 C-terminal domain-containing protein n=1 Tax=Spraguea lophii (strain 42_110) TaxID=1358809 RepID=S7WA61_SPRLO|nr:hypothetical protein SLOPH_1840 [Spraguea lophii 42_110]